MTRPGEITPVPPVVLRPVREDDLEALYAMAAAEPEPITTLPPDRDYLTDRIHRSLRSFYPVIREPGGESYFFVLESTESGELLGTSAIFARVGGYEPFYVYEIRESELRHEPLGISKKLNVLHLKLDHDGPSEIGSLYLAPKARRLRLAPLLSLARFLFVRLFPERFASHIIAELRGVCDPKGRSPFWEAVGRHFFGCDYMTADQLSARSDKSFLRDLMPRYPIYVPLLPSNAQAVLGQVHQDTLPALKLLRDQGFEYLNEVDIFDAGPVYGAEVNRIRAVREALMGSLAEVWPGLPNDGRALLARADLNFRCVLCPLSVRPDGLVAAPPEAVQALGLQPGDPTIHLTL